MVRNMADYSIISDVSNEIVKLIRENLCPELIQSPESIMLVSPTDKNADFLVGLYLYDIQELREYRQMDLIRVRGSKAKYPDKPLNLYFTIYINTKSQIMADSENEQRIIGRILQVLMDNTILYNTVTEENEEVASSLTFLTLSFEEKSKLWSGLNIPYQLALYFSVSPVLLSSRRVYNFARVLEAEYTTKRMDEH